MKVDSDAPRCPECSAIIGFTAIDMEDPRRGYRAVCDVCGWEEEINEYDEEDDV